MKQIKPSLLRPLIFITLIILINFSTNAQESTRSIVDKDYVLSSNIKITLSKKIKELRRLFAKNDSLQMACFGAQQNPESLSEKDQITLLFHMKAKSLAVNYFESFQPYQISGENLTRFEKCFEELIASSISCIQRGSTNFISITEAYNTLSTALETKELLLKNQSYGGYQNEPTIQQKVDSSIIGDNAYIQRHKLDYAYNSEKYGKLYIGHQRTFAYHIPENLEAEKLFYRLYSMEQPISRSFYDSLANHCKGEGNFRRIYLDMTFLRQGITDTSIANDLLNNLYKLTSGQQKKLFNTKDFAATLAQIADRHKENMNVAGTYSIVLYTANRLSDCIAFGTECLKTSTKNNSILSATFLAHFKQADRQYISAIEELRKLSIPPQAILEVLFEYLEEGTSLSERIKLLDYCKKQFSELADQVNFWPLGPNDDQIRKANREQVYTFIRFLHRNPELKDDVKQANHIEYTYWQKQSVDDIYANRALFINKRIPYDLIIEAGRYCIEEQAGGSRNRELIRQGCIPALKKAHAIYPQGYEACELLGDAYFYLGDGNTKDAWYSKAIQLGSQMTGRISYSGGKGGKAIKTGKRGGKFYINSRGNKTYIKR
jgi:hypothetical protein